ncbi:hypothetical protein SPONL_1563 [uncultured Candidatus Thioglobus sp.]|nr:hypothetical protein SPONL_1563 [uncultured Candidatus Thioglobus sp.]
MEIISNTELQKHIGVISKKVESNSFIVTTRGKPRMMMVPYFSEGSDMIDDYMEEYLLWKNRQKLQVEARQSLESGLSDLVI